MKNESEIPQSTDEDSSSPPSHINPEQTDSDNYENSPEKKRENTRSEIAKFYVYAFFFTIFLVFLTCWEKAWTIQDFSDLLIAVSGILSGPLGFIIGYYFKASDK